MIAIGQGIGLTVIVRVADPDPTLVAIALDSRADGVLVPYCEDPEMIQICAWKVQLHPLKGKAFEDVLNSEKFPSQKTKDYLHKRNGHKIMIVGIESIAAVNNLDNLISKGPIDGVFVGQNVIGIKGLIGQVTETTFVSSKVILINDTSHNVPGEINRTGEKVIVSGTKDRNKLEIDFLAVNTDIKVGDTVSTSGLGERFKAKIPIGKVISVEQDPEKEFSKIEINSFENLENLTDLILIWDYKPNMNPNEKPDDDENKGSRDNE